MFFIIGLIISAIGFDSPNPYFVFLGIPFMFLQIYIEYKSEMNEDYLDD